MIYMVQYREGVFETNSSSSHSIVIKRPLSTLVDEKNKRSSSGCGYIDREHKLHIHENDFSWGFSVLCHWIDRFAYALAAYGYDESIMNRIIDSVLESHQEVKDIAINGFRDRKFENLDDDDLWERSYGHIDHQSIGLLQEFLEHKQITVLDFINDDKYIVIIDNDNSNVFGNIMECGLFDKNAIAERFGD